MQNEVNYKPQVFLALIPFFGMFIILFMGIYYIKRESDLKSVMLYYIIFLAPAIIAFVLAVVLIRFAILPIGTNWIIIMLSVIIAVILMTALAYWALFLERTMLKKFADKDK